MTRLERQLMRDHLSAHHAVIRHQGCPACRDADRAAPAALDRRRRLGAERLASYLAPPPDPIRRNGHADD